MAEFPVVALWGNENAELFIYFTGLGVGLGGGLVQRVGDREFWELVI